MSTSQALVAYGTPVTFTATVSAIAGNGAPAAGSVDFFDTTTNTDLGSGAFGGGSGPTCTWTFTTGVKTFNVTPGDSIRASYVPGTGFAGSSGTAVQTVTARAIIVAATGVSKVYDGTTAATVVLSDNRVAGDHLADSCLQASFGDPSVGANKPVSVSGIAISGPDARNYFLENTTAATTADIVYQSVAVIDDGDPSPNWTTTGTWTNYAGQGYGNDVDQAAPVASANGVATAAWTFSGLNPSQYYLVETTWTRNSNRASNAPYTISGGAVTLPVVVDQQLSPVGVSADNWTWQELGVYQPASGTPGAVPAAKEPS